MPFLPITEALFFKINDEAVRHYKKPPKKLRQLAFCRRLSYNKHRKGAIRKRLPPLLKRTEKPPTLDREAVFLLWISTYGNADSIAESDSTKIFIHGFVITFLK